jgi:serine/threonine protein phosphatase PrpC
MPENTDSLTVQIHKAKTQLIDVPFTFARYSRPHEEHPERNEDYILIDAQRGLAAVFDGVGGHEGGGVAARVAAHTIQRHWKHVLRQAQSEHMLLKMPEDLDIQTVLKNLIIAANDYVRVAGYRKLKANGAPLSLGTTLVLAVFSRQEEGSGYLMAYAHVGDSRIYLLRTGEKLRRLTSDDGYFRILLKDEKIVEDDICRIDQAARVEELTETEKSYFDKRNGITQALGDKKSPEVHIDQIALEAGDRILFCSDGIHDNLIDREIEETLRRGARTTVAKALVQRAIERSHEENSLRAKKDDMSALVVTCHF